MSKPTAFWMVKQEPTSYAWSDFVKDGRTAWSGVRNFTARNHLRAMRKGDRVFYYHSVVGKEIVGLAEVARTAYADPTATDGEWSCVDLVPKRALARPVTLAELKGNAEWKESMIFRQSRLSVIPVTATEFAEVERLAKA